VENPTNYGLFIKSGPHSASTQTVTMSNNQVEADQSTLGYLNLAAPTSYTRSTYQESDNTFCGSALSQPFYVNGTARTWSTYTDWFGLGSEGVGSVILKDCQ
jgi:hypothetical protein